MNVIRAVPFPRLTYNPYMTFGSDRTVGLVSPADISPVLLRRSIEKSKFCCFNLSVCVIR